MGSEYGFFVVSYWSECSFCQDFGPIGVGSDVVCFFAHLWV